MNSETWLDRVRFGPDGLVPVVAQDSLSGNLLMLAWANRAALLATHRTGLAHYWSRSRQALWQKGETSGHAQRLVAIRIDCDGDAILYRVDQQGPACHTGQPTCFSSTVGSAGVPVEETEPGGHLLTRLATTIHHRAETRPAGSYTVTLLDHGIAKIAQKVGEEAVETVVAATAQDADRLAEESADLLYHLLVLLEARGVPLDAVLHRLQEREK